jgi:protein-disulfide isomerase-like protein with CxxC motif
MNPIVAWHFTDPACPWAYSSRPAIARLRWRFGAQIEWRLVLIGLSETTERYERNGYTPGRLANGWPKFQRRFGMPFGTAVKPRLSASSRACRAIVAARGHGPEHGYAALRALQLMQFTTTRLLDEDEDLRWALGPLDGLDAEAVVDRIDDPEIIAAYEGDKARSRTAAGTPTHVQGRHSDSDGPIRYTAPSVLFEHPDGRQAEVGGFQPFEAYDTALANLEPGLDRRPAPADPRDAVLEYPVGLTTAEVASIMRPSDLDDSDLGAARDGLIIAAEQGVVSCAPTASDALWSPGAPSAASADVPQAA